MNFRSLPAGTTRPFQRVFFYCLLIFKIFFVQACGGSGSDSSSITIVGELNDTGIIACANAEESATNCPQLNYPGQDAQFGRDVLEAQGTLIKNGGGKAGFDWLKLNSVGEALAEQENNWQDQGSETASTKWSCVFDAVTGLTWEVKESDSTHPRYADHNYTWFSSDNSTNGGVQGIANGGQCSTAECDTESYIEWVNAQGLCQFDDWRLPTIAELTSIAVMSEVLMAMDHQYFPNVPEPRFFSSETYALDPNLAWYVYFSDASVSFTDKGSASQIRLVRGGNAP